MEYDPPTSAVRTSDVLTHEILHVLGAGHRNDPLDVHSLMNLPGTSQGTSVFWSHLATEVDPVLYYRGPWHVAHGERVLPAGDQVFLDAMYGAHGSNHDRTRLHFWQPQYYATGGWRYATSNSILPLMSADFPFRYWASTTCFPQTPAPPYVFPAEQELLAALPSFTSVTGDTLQIELVLRSFLDNPTSVSLSGGGLMEVEVPPGGAWSGPPVVIEPLEIADSYPYDNLAGHRFALHAIVTSVDGAFWDDVALPFFFFPACEG